MSSIPSHWRSTADPEAHRVLCNGARLAALRATKLLHGGSDEVLDGLARVVCTVLGVPVAAVSLVDDRGQSFAGLNGLQGWVGIARGTPLSHSFCQHVVIGEEPLVIEDARLDQRMRHNPAIEDLGVVAYAGVPLITREGETLGALCAIGTEPRQWLESELQTLRDLATAAVAQLQLRAALDELTASHEAIRVEQERVSHDQTRLRAVDALTGLPSRSGFEHAVRRAIRTPTGQPNGYVLHSLQFDGDDVAAMTVAAAIVQAAAPEAVCARVSANAFAVLEPLHGNAAAQSLVERMTRVLEGSGGSSCTLRYGRTAVEMNATDSAGVLLRTADRERDLASWVTLSAFPSAPSRLARTAQERRVLLLDDYPSMLQWARVSLEAHGWTVYTAVETDEALALAAQLRDAQTPFDVVLCDESLSSMDSDSIGLLLRFDDAALPLVRLHSGAASDTRWPMSGESLDTTLSKPLTPDALRAALVHVIDHVPSTAVEYAEGR